MPDKHDNLQFFDLLAQCWNKAKRLIKNTNNTM